MTIGHLEEIIKQRPDHGYADLEERITDNVQHILQERAGVPGAPDQDHFPTLGASG